MALIVLAMSRLQRSCRKVYLGPQDIWVVLLAPIRLRRYSTHAMRTPWRRRLYWLPSRATTTQRGVSRAHIRSTRSKRASRISERRALRMDKGRFSEPRPSRARPPWLRRVISPGFDDIAGYG